MITSYALILCFLFNDLESPSTRYETIEELLRSVDSFYHNSALRREIQTLLKPIRDVERSLQRIQLHRGSPRDLSAIATAILQTAQICARLKDGIIDVWTQWALTVPIPMDFADTLQKALKDPLPLNFDEGHFIRDE